MYMIRLKKFRYPAVIMILLIIISAVFVHKYYIFNQPSEIIENAYIKDTVEIIRDAYGVPHIFAQNMKDVYFGWGYATAQDRIWQMELFRREMQGKLAEIYGKKRKKTDIFNKKLGLHRYAEDDLSLLSRGTEELLESYVRGVNVYLEDKTYRSKRFDELGYKPEPWTVVDVLSVEKFLAWGFHDGRKTPLSEFIGQFKDMIHEQREERIKEILLDNYHFFKEEMGVHEETRKTGRKELHEEIFAGSNCWAIDAEKSATGKPMFASDPHVPLVIPAYWHEVHLAVPKENFHCAGVTLPGSCIISIGRTQYVAWGLTKSYIDCVDVVEEKINPRNPDEYWDGTSWKPFKIRKERITVKDDSDIELIVKENDNGFVSKNISSTTVSLMKWSGGGASRGTDSYIKAYTAKTMHEFIQCLKDITVPILNMHFADSSGNVGYYVIGKIPNRTLIRGISVIPGWKVGSAWDSYVPFAENPHSINPSEHFIATANNRMTDSRYPYYLYNTCAPNYRYDRIVEYLSHKQKLNFRDMKNLQLDVYSIRAREIVPVIIAACEYSTLSEKYKEALQYLEKWDFRFTKDSAAPVIFENFYSKFTNNIFNNVMDEGMKNAVLKNSKRIIRNIIRKGYSAWLDDNTAKAKEKFKQIVISSFVEAVDSLVDICNGDIAQLQWGTFHRVAFRGEQGISKEVIPFARDGGLETLNRGSGLKLDSRPSKFGASYRIIVDFADSDVLYYSCLIPGQSEDPESRHYIDQVELWKKGKYKKVYRNKKDVLKNSITYTQIVSQDFTNEK